MAIWNHIAENFPSQMVEQMKDDQDAQEAGEGEEDKAHRGRGREVKLVMKAPTATSQRRMPENGATSASITRMTKAERRLKDLQARVRYMDMVGWGGEQVLKI